MNISNKKWKFSAVVLLISIVAACGMTPAEKKAQREAVRKQQKLQLQINAKSAYSQLNNNFVWRKNTKIPSQNRQFNYERFGKKYIEFNDDFLWEKVAIKRTWHDATKNCEKATVAGLMNWRLPTVDEASKLNWGPISNPYGGNDLTSFWTSSKVKDVGRYFLPNSKKWLDKKHQLVSLLSAA